MPTHLLPIKGRTAPLEDSIHSYNKHFWTYWLWGELLQVPSGMLKGMWWHLAGKLAKNKGYTTTASFCQERRETETLQHLIWTIRAKFALLIRMKQGRGLNYQQESMKGIKTKDKMKQDESCEHQLLISLPQNLQVGADISSCIGWQAHTTHHMGTWARENANWPMPCKRNGRERHLKLTVISSCLQCHRNKGEKRQTLD